MLFEVSNRDFIKMSTVSYIEPTQTSVSYIGQRLWSGGGGFYFSFQITTIFINPKQTALCSKRRELISAVKQF